VIRGGQHTSDGVEMSGRTVGTGESMAVGLRVRRWRALVGVLLFGVALMGLGTWSSFARASSAPGSLLAWGYNDFSQLGDGFMERTPACEEKVWCTTPVMVAAGAIPAGTTFTQVSVGFDHSLALSSTGQVYAWGNDLRGEVGNGAFETEYDAPVAVSIPGGASITQIAAGEEFSLALTTTGHLYAWGGNGAGELGDGAAPTASDVPVEVSRTGLPPGTTFTQVSAGTDFALALSSAGKLYAWGQNGAGELGDGRAQTESDLPVAVSAGAIPGGTKFGEIAAGAADGFALSTTGELYAWGFNNEGELGDGSTTESTVPVAVSTGAIAGGAIAQIAPGNTHVLAVGSNGKLYSWGADGGGELGAGSITGPPSCKPCAPEPVAVLAGAIPAGATISQIAAGDGYSLALSSTGQVYGWGEDEEAQLGNGSLNGTLVPGAVSLPEGTTIAAIARGPAASTALALVGGEAAAGGPGPPTVSITTPANGAVYTLGQVVAASYSCTAAGGAMLAAGAAGCEAPVTIGGAVDTSSAGPHTFTVTARDGDGQSATATTSYTVTAQPTTTTGSSTSTSTSSPTSTATTGASPGVASTPKGIEELLLDCSSSTLVLNDVYIQGGHVAIRGSAAKSLVGKKVKILFNEGKQVATATVGAGGQYETSAPLPPAKIRDSLTTRYTAEVGKLRSLHLKLVRRLLLEPPKASGTTVTLTGDVTLPLTKPVAPVIVEQQLECGKTTIAKTFTPPAGGRFDITLTVPANAKAAIYRLTSKVAANKHSVTHGFTTFSLPLPVALG